MPGLVLVIEAAVNDDSWVRTFEEKEVGKCPCFDWITRRIKGVEIVHHRQ